jgi:hypothetical protein
MNHLIVRMTDNLKVTNRTTKELTLYLELNKGDFKGTTHELLLYVSVLVKRVMQHADVFVVHLNDGTRIAFVHDDVPNMGVVTMVHERLTFKD